LLDKGGNASGRRGEGTEGTPEQAQRRGGKLWE
jgi:hypothetical protein